jgi:segregation and condensation protein B
MDDALIDSEEGSPLDPDAWIALHESTRIVEAAVFAATSPLTDDQIRSLVRTGVSIEDVHEKLQVFYGPRGISLTRMGGCWRFQTAEDIDIFVGSVAVRREKPSRAVMETLAIIAFHQPVTIQQIDDLRGVKTTRSLMASILESGWVSKGPRIPGPAKTETYVTTEAFLESMNLDSLADLPMPSEVDIAEYGPADDRTAQDPDEEIATNLGGF